MKVDYYYISIGEKIEVEECSEEQNSLTIFLIFTHSFHFFISDSWITKDIFKSLIIFSYVYIIIYYYVYW